LSYYIKILPYIKDIYCTSPAVIENYVNPAQILGQVPNNTDTGL